VFDFISKKFSSIVNELMRTKKLTATHIDEWLAKVSDGLLEADVSLEVVQAFTASIKQEALGKRIEASLKPGEQLVKIVNDQLITFMGDVQKPFQFKRPSIVLLMGLQGAGKTTTIAKLAHYVQKESEKVGKRPKILVASVDFYRPAAITQLEQLAHQLKIDFYRATATQAVQASCEIRDYYKRQSFDYLFLDTAGRLHVDDLLMDELAAVKQAINPSVSLLVIDGMTGQEALRVARSFEEKVAFDGAIITKMDSDARGGVAFSFSYALHKRVLFLAEGEKPHDLLPFDAQRMASRILGMGDIATLAERANEKLKQADAHKALDGLEQGRLSLRDFSKQLTMVSQLGSLAQLIKYLPGAMTSGVSTAALQQGEADMKKFRAIFSSMSTKELDGAYRMTDYRKKELAKGAGVAVADLDKLFQRFEQAQQYAKLLKNNNFMKNNFR